MFQIKEQDKISEKYLSDMELTNLPDRIIQSNGQKMFTDLGEEWMNFNKRQKIKYQTEVTEMENIITALKYTRQVQQHNE